VIALAVATVLLAAANASGDEVTRLDRESRRLLGRPYQLGPLGEEAPPDVDPRFRLDAFDCTTYIETVLALALAGENELAARDLLDRIRYTDGVATYHTRRHLIDAQWIPELVAAGLLRDVTRLIGGRATRTATIRLGRAAWESTELERDLGLEWNAVPAGRHSLRYLPWVLLERERIQDALPAVAVLSLVAAPARETPTLVTHQGLLLRAPDGALVVRHASTSHRLVIEEPLERFAERSRRRRSRTVLGVNVLAVDLDAWADPPATAAD
jgi:hypothetical protein